MTPQLTVGFDARLLAHETTPTGVGQYTRQLLNELWNQPGLGLRLYCDKQIPGETVHVVNRWPGLPWQQTALVWALRRDRPQVYHAPSFSIPMRSPVPTVVTVHDLSFERYPEYVQPDTQRYLRRMVPASIRRATRIITPSRQIAEELAAYYHLDEETAGRLRPIPLGVDLNLWKPAPLEAVVRWKKRNDLEHPYLLFVGTREPRKNLVRLTSAYARVRTRLRDVELVLAGPDGPRNETLARLMENTPGVRVLPYVAQADLPYLVQGALGLCYVSEYEGFGLPVVEAMAVGTPVLTTRGSAMAEVAGPWAVYTSPDDVEDIADGLLQLVAESHLRRQAADQARAVASKYTWAETARRTADVYKELAEAE